MGPAERTLYASVRRIVRAFDAHAIPFTGPAGTDLVCWNLDPVAALAAAFRRPGAASFEGMCVGRGTAAPRSTFSPQIF